MDEWDKGHWCDVCHQKHYQISPACNRRRAQRAELARFAARLRPELFVSRGDPAEADREETRLMNEFALLRMAALRADD